MQTPNSTPPPNNDRETFDEWVAVILAIAAVGAVLFWGMGRQVNWRTVFSESIVPSRETDRADTAIASSSDRADSDTESNLDRFRDGASEMDDGVREQAGRDVLIARSLTPLILELPQPSDIIPTVEPDATPEAATDSEPEANDSADEPSLPDDAMSETAVDTAEDAAAVIAEDGEPSSDATAEEPTTGSVNFVDVPDGYWAKPFIDKMGQFDVLQGVDGESLQPDEPITRAQYAALIAEVFTQNDRQISVPFGDIDDGYWAQTAIDAAVRAGFLSGYPGQVFRPDEPITRMQVLLSLNSGLELPPSTRSADEVLGVYNDRQQIPEWAIPAIAATTEAQIVVSPDDNVTLSPDRPATRAEVISMVYQALVQQGEAEALDSPYVVTP